MRKEKKLEREFKACKNRAESCKIKALKYMKAGLKPFADCNSREKRKFEAMGEITEAEIRESGRLEAQDYADFLNSIPEA